MPQPFRGVLTVIVGEGPETDAVVGRAAALADEAHARLTIAALVDREELTDALTQAFTRVLRFELAFWDLVAG